MVTNCNQLKMNSADGKLRLTDVANTEQLLRIIQSIPSKKQSRSKCGLRRLDANELKKQLILYDNTGMQHKSIQLLQI